MAVNVSLKRIQVDKTARSILITVAITIFIVVFALISSKALITQLSYQNRVEQARQTALNKLKYDVASEQKLVTSYAKFVSKNPNIIGGVPGGTGPNDGDNAKIVLDALPSQYDYPALTSSIQYLLNKDGANIDSIGGTDQQANIASNGSLSASSVAAPTSPSSGPAAPAIGTSVPMPFQFSVDAPYAGIQQVLTSFEESVRPLQLQTLSISGDQSDLTLTATAQSYYQPQTKFNLTTETVR